MGLVELSHNMEAKGSFSYCSVIMIITLRVTGQVVSVQSSSWSIIHNSLFIPIRDRGYPQNSTGFVWKFSALPSL